MTDRELEALYWSVSLKYHPTANHAAVIVDFARQVANVERSECAKVCEDQASAHDDFHNYQAAIGCDECAAAIRARTQP